MTKQLLMKIVAGVGVGLLAMVAGPSGLMSPVAAQDGSESAESKSGEAADSDTKSASESGEAAESSKKESEENAGDSEAGSDNQKTASEKQNEKQKTKDKQGNAEATAADGEKGKSGESKKPADKASGEASKGDKSNKNEKKIGPGGREMRTDYPGTEESKQPSMSTDRIEGLEFGEGDNPSKAYDMELKELETRIDDLKEKVFQSKSRIVLLKETVLGGNLSGSRATVIHESRLGSQFKLTRAVYSLDGSRVYNKVGKEALAGKKEMTVYDGSITAGNHNVSIVLEYKGSGYGIFNYMEGYNVRITSSCQFQAQAGKATTLRVRAVKKGGAFTRVENQPGIQCRISEKELSTQKMESLEGAGEEGGSSEGAGSSEDQSGEQGGGDSGEEAGSE